MSLLTNPNCHWLQILIVTVNESQLLLLTNQLPLLAKPINCHCWKILIENSTNTTISLRLLQVCCPHLALCLQGNNRTWATRATRQENTRAQVNNTGVGTSHVYSVIWISLSGCLWYGKEKEIPIYTSNPTRDILTP